MECELPDPVDRSECIRAQLLKARDAFRASIKKQPGDEPDETDRTGDDERARQPHAIVIIGTTSGATSAPMFVPELKIPVASARSFFGNHSATVLIAAGKFPGFTEAEKETRDTKAEDSSSQRVAHRCCAPEDDGERETFARADAIDQTSDAEQTDRVGSLE